MTQFLLQTLPITQSSSTFSAISCSLKSHNKNSIANNTTKPAVTLIPATDRVIDFGKHRGKMLGTLPSSYLKWVSKNLRAQDFEQWAKLADQVLEDPVYRDRIEWEFAENLLTGNNNDIRNKYKNKNMGSNESSVSQLLELSERFGWDNEDKVGWSKVNFELVGTSKGRRIPRMVMEKREKEKEEEMLKVEREEERVGGLLSESEERRRRRERRNRVMEKMGKGKLGNENGDGGDVRNQKMEKKKKKSDLDSTGEIRNPFPGREALLKKVMMSRKRFL